MKRKLIFIFTAFAGLWLYSLSSAFAETAVTQEVTTGFQQKTVNSPESKFEEYGEVPNGIVVDHYQLNAQGECTDFEFEANNVFQNNQSAEFELSGARYGFNGSWNEIPHLFSKESKTLFIDQGNGHLILPDPIQQAMQAGGNANFVANISSFNAGAHIQPLQTQTNTGALGFDFNFTDALKLNVGASETMKKGYKAEGIRIDGDFTEVARPVDFKTYNSDVGLGYAGKQLQWGLNYNFSSFKNGFDTFIVDNPFQFTNSATKSGTGANSLEPDNYAHTVGLDGGLNLPAHSRLNANANFIYMKQNANLMPYTSNPFYPGSDPSTLPTDRVDAKVIDWVQDYNFTSRPVKPLDVGIRFHSDQLHNESAEITFPVLYPTESTNTAGSFTPEHFNYRKNALSESLGWRIVDPLRFGFKYGTEWIYRDDREVKKNREDSFNFTGDLTPSQAFLMRVGYLNARRRMGDFSEDDNQIPNIRLYDISDRDRNQGNVLIQLNTARTSTSFNGALGHDKYYPGLGDLTAGNTNYSNQMMGLQDTRTAKAGLDLNLDLSERLGIYTYYEYEQDKTTQRADSKSSNQITPDQGTFTQRQDTRYDMGGFAINIRAVKEFLDFKLGYDITSSKANYDFLSLDATNATNSIGGGPKRSPPESRTTKQDFSFRGKAHATRNLDITLAYLFEKYDVFDWATDNLGLVAPAASNQRNIFLGDASHDYKAHVVSIKADYKF